MRASMTWWTPLTGAGRYAGPRSPTTAIWRDNLLLLCVLLFTIVWWDVDHSRSNWLPMFILLILLSVVATVYALRACCVLPSRLRAGGAVAMSNINCLVRTYQNSSSDLHHTWRSVQAVISPRYGHSGGRI